MRKQPSLLAIWARLKGGIFYVCRKTNSENRNEIFFWEHPGIDYDGFVYCAQYCFGQAAVIYGGTVPISFENLTVLMAGIFFGPLAGLTVGACADLIGCLLVGYAINPIITAGAASVGFISGLVYKNCFRTKPKLRLAASVGAAHVIGSMIIKSIGLRIYFGYPLQMVALRVPLYIVIGCAEGYIIYLLLRNKAFGRQLERMKDR